MEIFFIFIVLAAIACLVYGLFRHFYPVTPPTAGTIPTQTTPINWDRVWKGIKFVAAIAGIFFLFSLAYAMLKNGGIGSGRGDSSSQEVEVRDNYGVIQQNDIHVTNIVQPTKKQVNQNRKTKQVVTQKGNTAPKVSFKRYLDTNEDPSAISASMEKDAEIDPRKLLR